MSNISWFVIAIGVLILAGFMVWIFASAQGIKDADDYTDIAFKAYLDENNITSGSPVIKE